MLLVLTPDAVKHLKSLPKADAHRLVAALQDVADAHPLRPSFVTELKGQAGVWRARKGDYRAVYRLTDTTMTVITVGHRKDVYE